MPPADAYQSEMIRAVRRDVDLQRRMCDPEYNPDAAAFFVFNFCQTSDEERHGIISHLPPPIWGPEVPKTEWYGPGEPSWALKFIEALDQPRPCPLTGRDDPHNIHAKKPRRMAYTWMACFYNLWALMWVRGYSSVLLSKSREHVDDSGRTGTKVFSMFSRMRFAYNLLPDHVRKFVEFSFMSAVCSENDGWSVGRAPTEQAGRGGGSVRVFVDECAYLEYMRSIHVALDPACKFGKVYMGTVDDPGTLFSELDRMRPPGWRFIECDWKEDPAKTGDVRPATDSERGRYGSHVSSWFINSTVTLEDDDIAREFLKDDKKSTRGAIYREFSRQRHVKDPGELLYDPALPVRVGLDFGMERKTVGVIGQPIAKRRLRVLRVYQGKFRNAPDNAMALLDMLVALTGLEPGNPGTEQRKAWNDRVCLVPDPSAVNEEHGSGIPPLDWYTSVGLERWMYPLIQGGGSVTQGNRVVRMALSRDLIEFAWECGDEFFGNLEGHRLPTDRRTGEVKSNKPVHDMSSHGADGFRYLVTSVWTADDLPAVSFPAAPKRAEPKRPAPSGLYKPDPDLASLRRPLQDYDRALAAMHTRERLTVYDGHRRDL